jgi:hypothetical protein
VKRSTAIKHLVEMAGIAADRLRLGIALIPEEP